MQKFTAKIVNRQISRGNDGRPYGSGQFGASRTHRFHKGLDIVSVVGENIYSPIDAKIIRKSLPYKDEAYSKKGISIDHRYMGLLMKGIYDWEGYRIKMWYFKPLKFSGEVTAGEWIGRAQDLTIMYPGITNHIHIEVEFLGKQINPFSLWRMCF